MKELEEIVFDPENEDRQIALAKLHLKEFFEPKTFYCGGSIPSSLLFSREAIELVRFTEFDPGIKFCYEQVTSQLTKPAVWADQPDVDWDVQIVLNLLRDCKTCQIPIPSQAGIILLFFRFCHGCSNVTRRNYLSWLNGNAIAA